MKKIIKEILKKSIAAGAGMLGRTRVGRFIYAHILSDAMERARTVEHNGTLLTFAVPNAQNDWRVETFSTKEPETLRWIDSLPQGSTLWDIGANVGLYSCYAAKARKCTVVAFEPSVFNLELLARNIYLNGLVNEITIVPLPISDSVGTSQLNMSSKEWGGALSTFGERYGQDGLPLDAIFEFQTVGLSMYDAVNALRVPPPNYLKIDVDGIEHLILRGGAQLLSQVDSVIIEVNDNFAEQAESCVRLLGEAGLRLVEKSHSQIVEESTFRGAFNQIWARPLNTTDEAAAVAR